VEDRRNGATGDLLDRATEALCHVPVPPGPPAEVVRRVLDAGLEVEVVRLPARKSANGIGRRIRRIVRIAVAASILAAVGVFVSWVVKEGSSNIAFANVGYVLEHLQSATFDMTMQMAGRDNTVTMRAKGSFLAPSRQRIEAARKGDMYGDMVIIADYETAKGIVLLPTPRIAVVIDSAKIKDQIHNPMACMFEMMRCLVREGRSRSGRVTPVGKKEIDGQTVVGFLARCPMGDMTLWADPRTAKPVYIELDMPAMKVHGVLNNFRYNVQLDPSLFSLKPPPGYVAETMNVGLPLEQGLIQTLRAVAEQRNGMFPKQLGMNREVLDALEAIAGPDLDAIAASGDEQAAEVVMSTLPFEQKYMQGILFYMSLKPENDAHYAGGGVKLGTPDRPIFWYKPTGAQRFRVIYADLRVKEMTPDEVKALRSPAGK
jgi:outer membrane lipoprotein-sorting protein